MAATLVFSPKPVSREQFRILFGARRCRLDNLSASVRRVSSFRIADRPRTTRHARNLGASQEQISRNFEAKHLRPAANPAAGPQTQRTPTTVTTAEPIGQPACCRRLYSLRVVVRRSELSFTSEPPIVASNYIRSRRQMTNYSVQTFAPAFIFTALHYCVM